MAQYLFWDTENEEHEGVIDFWKQVINHTTKWLKSVHTRDSGLHYWGELNTHECLDWWCGDTDKPVVVLWHSINESYSDIEMRALMKHFKNEFDEIEGLAWHTEGANGNGGVEWLMINLTESTQEALENAYEQWQDCCPVIDDENAYYYATETRESEQLRMEEEEYDVREWITWELYNTPFEDIERDWLPSYVDSDWGIEWIPGDCISVYDKKNFDMHEYLLTEAILPALNEHGYQVDADVLQKFFDDDEKWNPYRLRQCAFSGEWAREKDMKLVGEEWFLPAGYDDMHIEEYEKRQPRLPGIDHEDPSI